MDDDKKSGGKIERERSKPWRLWRVSGIDGHKIQLVAEADTQAYSGKFPAFPSARLTVFASTVRQQRIFKHSPSRAAGPAAHDPQATAPAAPQAPGHFFAQHSCLVSWPCTTCAAAAPLTGRGWCGICRSRCALAVLDLLGSSLFRCGICHNCPQRRAASHRRHRREQRKRELIIRALLPRRPAD